jgi:rubredoxin
MSAPACPHCGAGDSERVGQWGGQLITSQWRCRACGTYFEALRDELDEPYGSSLPMRDGPSEPAG